jgi:P-aminobenzoate N-oxygenase AurF
MQTTSNLPRTALRSAQLVAASERTTLDPFREVDWDTPIDDSAFHLPPELLPLFGTSVWEAMGEAERIAYSRHELAAMFGAGIWFENALMQLVLRHLVQIPVTDPSHRYLLVEVADECRHSTMFGEYIRRAGTPAYGPRLPFQLADDTGGDRVLGYLLILAVEELLDFANRSTMRDERVHPVSRQIAKVHVLEEARHVSFAKTYLTEVWSTLSAEERDVVLIAAPVLVGHVVRLNLDPAVYEHLGIADGVDLVEANRHYRHNVIAGLAKLTSFLGQVGIIDPAHRPEWVQLGLLAA